MSVPPAVVVVNYGSHQLIDRNLDPDLVRALGAPVVVVDNFSSDDEREQCRAMCSRRGFELVAAPGNSGFGAGSNAGFERAFELGCQAAITLNPDAVLTADAYRQIAKALAADPLCLVSPHIVAPDGRNFFRGSVMDLDTGFLHSGWAPDDDKNHANWISGACLGMSRQAFTALGGFSEEYFLYWEDVDLSWRAGRLGLRLRVLDASIVHDAGGTQESGSSGLSLVYYRQNCRNRLVFAARNLSRGRRLRWLLATPRQSLQILLRGGRRQFLTEPRVLLAGLSGSLAGAGHVVRSLAQPAAPRRAGRGPVLVAHPSSDLYGSDRVLLETIQSFVDEGRRVVAVLPSPGPLDAELERRGAEVTYCPSPVLRKSALNPRGLLGIATAFVMAAGPARRLIRETDPEVVFVNTLTVPAWIAYGRLGRRSTICHVHEAEDSAPAAVRRLLYLPLLATHGLVVNSRFALRVLQRTWPMLTGRARVLYNGVPGPSRVTLPREHPVPLRLLFIGRLSPRKGPQVAIDALADLVNGGLDARLQLLGDVFDGYEWFADQLHDQVRRLGLEDRVEFLGFRPEVWPLMEDADIVVVPSTIDEPYGNTAVEALLAQRPLVVSQTSGLLEASEGFAAKRPVPPSDPVALANGIRDLLADWPTVRQQVVTDRELALGRNAPERYRRNLRRIVAGFSGAQSGLSD